MLGILDENYSNLNPIKQSHNALVVFNLESAKIAFQYGNVDFVIVLNEKTGKYAYCHSLDECEQFLKTSPLNAADAKKYLSEQGYGTGSNFTIGTIADLMVQWQNNVLRITPPLKFKCIKCGTIYELIEGEHIGCCTVPVYNQTSGICGGQLILL